MANGSITFGQDYNETCSIELSDGTKQRALHTVSNALPYLNVGQDFFLKVQQGLVPGHSVVDKFGVNKKIMDKAKVLPPNSKEMFRVIRKAGLN